jgi:hypothetical protein
MQGTQSIITRASEQPPNWRERNCKTVKKKASSYRLQLVIVVNKTSNVPAGRRGVLSCICMPRIVTCSKMHARARAPGSHIRRRTTGTRRARETTTATRRRPATWLDWITSEPAAAVPRISTRGGRREILWRGAVAAQVYARREQASSWTQGSCLIPRASVHLG